MTIYTTLNKIREHKPCGIEKDSTRGFRKLLNFLGKTTSDDEPLKFSTILKSNGLDDALWCFRSVYDTHEKEIRSLTADYAERVLCIWEDWAMLYAPEHLGAPRKAIEASRDYANGLITEKELDAARDAAWDAARAAAVGDAWNARYAAGAAAGAARDAAWDAARAAAVGDAAWAAMDAAGAGAGAARAAAGDAAWTAAGDAWDAERKVQAELLIKYFG